MSNIRRLDPKTTSLGRFASHALALAHSSGSESSMIDHNIELSKTSRSNDGTIIGGKSRRHHQKCSLPRNGRHGCPLLATRYCCGASQANGPRLDSRAYGSACSCSPRVDPCGRYYPATLDVGHLPCSLCVAQALVPSNPLTGHVQA